MARQANAHPVNGEYAYDGTEMPRGGSRSGKGPARPRSGSPRSRMPQQAQAHRLAHHRKTKAITIALWILIAIGAIGGLRALLFPGGGSEQVAVQKFVPTTDFEGFATYAMKRYFTATEAEFDTVVSPLFCNTSAVDFTGVDNGSMISVEPMVIQSSVSDFDKNYYSVYMGVQLNGVNSKGGLTRDFRFYNVSVVKLLTADNKAAYCIRSGPTVTPAPREVDHGKVPGLAVDGASGELSEDQVDVIKDFMNAYLVHEGRLSNVTTNEPGSIIRPIPDEAVFSSVEVIDTSGGAVGNSVAAKVHVKAIDKNGRTQILEYNLALTQGAGAWKVDEILLKPRLAPQVASNTETNTQGD